MGPVHALIHPAAPPHKWNIKQAIPEERKRERCGGERERKRERRDAEKEMCEEGEKSKKGQTPELKMERKKTRGGLEGENEIREVEKNKEKEVGKV